jgi:hypothetical protein
MLQRTGTVIYSLNARGLTADFMDVSSSKPTTFSSLGQEAFLFQEALKLLSANTGGRALINTNDLSSAVNKSLKENSTYYLLAWKPDQTDKGSSNKFHRIEVNVIGQKDVKVLVRRGFFDTPSATKNNEDKKVDIKNNGRELEFALGSYHPQTDLPINIYATYAEDAKNGPFVTTLVQFDRKRLDFITENNQQVANVDTAIVICDMQGNFLHNFKKKWTIQQSAGKESQDDPINMEFFKMKPGLYQVRVAVRDIKSGRLGSSYQWITVPDLKSGQLALSSLAFVSSPEGEENVSGEQTFNVSRRFRKSSRPGIIVYIYNAQISPETQQPDLTVQVQLFRDDQPVSTYPLQKVPTEGMTNFTNIPYAFELPLNDTPPGRYTLNVALIDKIAKSTASQSVKMIIE